MESEIDSVPRQQARPQSRPGVVGNVDRGCHGAVPLPLTPTNYGSKPPPRLLHPSCRFHVHDSTVVQSSVSILCAYHNCWHHPHDPDHPVERSYPFNRRIYGVFGATTYYMSVARCVNVVDPTLPRCYGCSWRCATLPLLECLPMRWVHLSQKK